MAAQQDARGERVVIGVDSSTQATKAVAVGVDTGTVLGTGRHAHSVTSGAGRESDPEQWWAALTGAVAATGHAGRAEAVAVAGQQHGLVALGADGRPVRPALLWNDVRSAPQAAALVERFGAEELAERTGSVPTAAFTIAKWAWLRENEPAAADRVAAVRLPHDYLTEQLTGAATTDRGDVSGTGWWTPHGYDGELLGHVGLSAAALPEVVAPGTAAGRVRGGDGPLRPGTLVAAGTGDNMAAALGLGLRPGSPVVSLGTSGTVFAVTRGRPRDPSGVVAGFADALGGWLPLACTLNCTLAVDRFAALLGRDREAVEPGGTAVVLPFLDGERTPNLPYASGLLHGLRHDTTPGQVLQAAYDGAAYSLLAAVDDVLRAGGEENDPLAPLLLVGGGARGTAWRETMRRLSGRPVQVPAAEELVALGAAAQAAGVLTGEAADEVARRWGTGRPAVVLDPRPADTEALARIGDTLRRSHDLMARQLPAAEG
ncbi:MULTISPECIES: xylulokinase [Streptomycetaceae]|uniref:Xylulose kinase n=1 Tax=Streptantibioticus cattleyicolor (strain ATCC 35852 / DSM 46488 / JCM 4925 / NBRC 14057 / NRRL 8057) TaxID=1003195 RepID=F8K2Y5_STREN|nr:MULTISPECIES: xylulokinase [Streptomycetaceae]AEW92473.1 xylulose kinase [Streptantibioticus cattleyicolor NRRL 8057 = DSM 46488]MYS57277.1 xylulokinase [Streptomyces sp. SID5468]CCB72834.1 Xylulose kinase [Streptantibioticus cattleyicolor NRRL 8057 = DSM 46488]